MKHRKKYALLATASAAALLLAGCGGGGSKEDEDKGATEKDMVETVENDGDSIDGEKNLRVGLVAESALPGVFESAFSEINTDTQLQSFTSGNLLRVDESFQFNEEFVDGYAAKLEYDQDRNVSTLTLKEGVMWHGNDEVDSKELTVDDVIYQHEIVGHQDYDGARYGEDFRNIKGMEEYHDGESDTIEGLVKLDDHTLEVHYIETLGFRALQAGGQFWPYAAPRHYYEGLEVTEIADSPQVREKPIGFGPFKVENIVPGESFHYVANEDFFDGAPKLDKVTVERVPASGIVAALEQGEFDVTFNFPTDQYEAVMDGIEGYTELSTAEGSYDYISFKLGEWDGKENVYDPDAKMANLNLRQAMAYALDIDAAGERFFDGLRFRATSHIVPTFGKYFDEDLVGYPYDPEKAEELLEEAGYTFANEDDEFRTDPDGEELVIYYAARAGGDTSEPLAKFYLQSWEKIGLNVQLVDDRLHETNTFYDRVQADDPKIDVHEGGWSVGSDPTPDGLYGEKAAFNFSRFVDEKNNELMAKMLSDKTVDEEYRYDAFYEWQDYFMNEAAPAIPTFWRTSLQFVNDRVSAWGHSEKSGHDAEVFGMHHVDLVE